MVGGGGKMADDGRVHTGEDFLEQVGRNAAGTGKAREQSVWAQKLEGEQVDVLVTARGLFGERRRRRKLGRIEHDQVEAAALVAQDAQLFEHVGLPPFGARRVQFVAGEVVAR